MMSALRLAAALAAALAVLSTAEPTALGVSNFMPYPGYNYIGGLTVSGAVRIRAADDDSTSQTLEWYLEGIDAACTSGAGDTVTNGCGIHVHSGTTCEDASSVGGHFYDGKTDPWLDVTYVAETDDGLTFSYGNTTVTTGVTLSDLEGKAFVVHELVSGGRIACGILLDLACSAHDNCSASQFGVDGFCYGDMCSSCDECHYCDDGVDGTCGSFCDGPTEESGPCGTPACADDDDGISALASGHHGLTISGCADVAAFCGHGKYGSILEAVCPATCRSSSCYVPGERRLADDVLV
jgi:hypothetical protein